MEASQRNVNSYLALSIFNMLCCCLPLGIAALVFSIQVFSPRPGFNSSLSQNSGPSGLPLGMGHQLGGGHHNGSGYWEETLPDFNSSFTMLTPIPEAARNANNEGNINQAASSSRTARILNIVGIVIGAIMMVIIIVVIALGSKTKY